MAKMYYSLEEVTKMLGCSEEQLRALVRNGKLREFRDAGRVNYRVDEVDMLAASTGDNVRLEGSGELTLEDSAELPLAPKDASDSTGMAGSDAPIDLGGSDSGVLSLEGSGSGELQLEDSAAAKSLTDSSDALSLEEVDHTAVEGMKKDDTVITNIGISVFDDDDLEIAADPMAKTVLTGGDEHLGLEGSGAGSGLLDLTRESDDTSLGAELLEGIDMGDTGETVMPTEAAEAETPLEPAADLGEAELAPDVRVGMITLSTVPAASPACTGLLAAATLALALAGAMAVATSMQAWPDYLNVLAGQFWFFLGGTLVAGGLFAGVGYLVGRQATAGPRPPKPKKPKKGKGKKGEPEPEAEAALELGEPEPLS